MNALLETVDELRKMSESELTSVGEASLLERLRDQAEATRLKHGPLSPGNLETILSDGACVRYPTRLVLEFGEMGLHQFAQPELDHRDSSGRGRVLYLRPVLGKRPDLISQAVSYMIPVINYGRMVTDLHCIAYGAVLMGLDEETYYQAICGLADFVGAENLLPDGSEPALPEGSSGGCGSGGCGCGS